MEQPWKHKICFVCACLTTALNNHVWAPRVGFCQNCAVCVSLGCYRFEYYFALKYDWYQDSVWQAHDFFSICVGHHISFRISLDVIPFSTQASSSTMQFVDTISWSYMMRMLSALMPGTGRICWWDVWMRTNIESDNIVYFVRPCRLSVFST